MNKPYHMVLFEEGCREINMALNKISGAMLQLSERLTSEADDCLKILEEVERLREENTSLRLKLNENT